MIENDILERMMQIMQQLNQVDSKEGHRAQLESLLNHLNVERLLGHFYENYRGQDVDNLAQMLADEMNVSDFLRDEESNYQGMAEAHEGFLKNVQREQEEVPQLSQENLSETIGNLGKRLADMVDFEVDQESHSSGMYQEAVEKMNKEIAKKVALFIKDREVADLWRGGSQSNENISELERRISENLNLNAEKNLEMYHKTLAGIAREMEDLQDNMRQYQTGREEASQKTQTSSIADLKLDEESILKNYQANHYSKTPLVQEIMLCNVQGPKIDEYGQVKELGIAISTSIIEKAIQEGRQEIFEASQDYVTVTGENMRLIVTPEEHARVMEKSLEKAMKEQKEKKREAEKEEELGVPKTPVGETPKFF